MEEDLLLGFGESEPGLKLGLDGLSCIGESGRIGSGGSLEVLAVTAVIAVNKVGNKVLLFGGVSDGAHASVLPRVFDVVNEVDVVSDNVETSILINVVLSIWLTKLLAKHSRAVGDPVIFADVFGSHWILGSGLLEPSELCAVLPSPLSHVVVDVIGNILE